MCRANIPPWCPGCFVVVCPFAPGLCMRHAFHRLHSSWATCHSPNLRMERLWTLFLCFLTCLILTAALPQRYEQQRKGIKYTPGQVLEYQHIASVSTISGYGNTELDASDPSGGTPEYHAEESSKVRLQTFLQFTCRSAFEDDYGPAYLLRGRILRLVPCRALPGLARVNGKPPLSK